MPPLYPLRFEPIFKRMLWGGTRLPGLLRRPCPEGGPIGEAWLVSDVDGHLSVVSNGPWAGTTLRQLLERHAPEIVGPSRQNLQDPSRFPLLLKFIDAQQELSVQVHPDDHYAARLGPGYRGKTEAWVVLERDPQQSRIYAGFRPGVTADTFRLALQQGQVADTLHSFIPQLGDCIYLEAGTVHALGAGLLVFEIQQSSDITYRLYDWDRIDKVTGRPRPLHIDQALACIDWSRGPCYPVRPAVVVSSGLRREGLVRCRYFTLERLTLHAPTVVGQEGQCRLLVLLEGIARYQWQAHTDELVAGDVLLLPAVVGAILLQPCTATVTLLECGLPS